MIIGITGGTGCGKTTLLRDLIRQISDIQSGAVVVVDERGELFPEGCGFPAGKHRILPMPHGCFHSFSVGLLSKKSIISPFVHILKSFLTATEKKTMI